jgi:dihydroflavonol-4-reductase
LGVELAVGDLLDPQSVIDAARGCRAVIHAGGKFRFWGRREGFFNINVEGTRNALDAALQAGARRFVYISTIVVVGKPPVEKAVTEDVTCRPQDAYQQSKLAAEQLALDYHRDHGLPVVVLRPGAYYGPWGRYAFNRLFFEDPLQGLPVQVHRGRHIVFPVYVKDVARASAQALERGRAGEIFNVCGACLTHREINATVDRLIGRSIRRIDVPGWVMTALARGWTWLSRFTGREPYYPIGLYPYVFYDWQVSTEKARRELRFEPIPFEQGARETLKWYLGSG